MSLFVLVSFFLCGKVSSFSVAPIVAPPNVGCTNGSSDIIRCSSFSLIPAAIPTTRLSLFGNIFGNGDDDSDNKNENELATYRGLVLKENSSNGKDGNNSNADATFDSLSTYIKSWSNLFQTGSGGKGGTIKLTTPVKILLLEDDNDDDDNNEGNNDAVVASTGVRLVFQNVDTGYKNKKEEEEEQQQQQQKDGNGKREKKKPKLEGGVEILVQKIIAVDEKRNNNNNNRQDDDDVQVQVRAKRCNFNDDTIIKEMSEETIIKELGKAISVWKRQQQKL